MQSKGELGFWEIFSIGVGGMIGGGIFAVLGLSLELADGAAPIAFLLAGLVALATSYSYAKLARRYPSEGGTVEYLVQAYGDTILAGGLNILLLGSYIVMLGLYSYAFASYGASLAGESRIVYDALVALIVSILVLVNLLGAKTSGRVELGLVAFKLAVLLLVAGASIAVVDYSRLSPARWPPIASIIAGGMIIFLAYEGFELVANAARDAKNYRALRNGLYASVVVVIAVYVLVALVAAGTLSPREIAEARDYALAVVAEPVLGAAGFYMVVAAALASTGSAINATLYGSARVSYVVAKYGEAPKTLGKKVWRGAYEGVVFIGALGALLALTASLEQISTAGSAGFLIVFLAVNTAALRLRRRINANPAVLVAAIALNTVALLVLLYKLATTSPSQLAVLAGLVTASFALEALYRAATGRRLKPYVDRGLEELERAIKEWEKWVPSLARTIAERVKGVEVYLVGSIARGEPEKAHDVDVLIIAPSHDHAEKARRELEAILSPHPVRARALDVHITVKGKKPEKAKRLA